MKSHRLTRRFNGKIQFMGNYPLVLSVKEMSKKQIKKVLKKLYDYEELEDSGKLFILNPSLGDTLYYVYKDSLEIATLTIDKVTISYRPDEIVYHLDHPHRKNGMNIKSSSLGKEIFVTMEEAEKAKEILAEKKRLQTYLYNLAYRNKNKEGEV